MSVEDAKRIAVVDLGTNSTRLLIADLTAADMLEEVERRTVVTRLGEGVDATGRLSDHALARVYECLAGYRDVVDRSGAGRAVAVATSAVREADNGAELRAEVEHRYGFDVRVITGEEEARLTFLGATSGRPGGATTLVIDIGGGSTELVIGEPGRTPSFHVSTRLGSVRHTERHLHDDPPTHASMEALAAAAATIVGEAVPENLRGAVQAGIAVAGTATSLAAIDQHLDPYDPAKVHGYRLLRGECDRMLSLLAATPVADRREVPGLHPDRAPTIVAGVAILVEAMRLFGLSEVETSEADILHGAALDVLTPG